MTEIDQEMEQLILDSKNKKIFVVGQEQSGFVGPALTLRLMNIGLPLYFLGENETLLCDQFLKTTVWCFLTP
jgi:D-arabinose 5-phosphate isomerase GutQ